jgi:hypothetical protein
VVAEVDAQVGARPQNPRQVCGVRETELAAGEERSFLEQRVELGEALVESGPGCFVAAAQRVVGARQTIEALDEEPPGGPLGRVGRPERWLRVAVLEVFHDHGRLRQHEAVIIEHGHPA